MPVRSVLFLALFLVAVLAAIAAGFSMAGSPAGARAKKLDALRVGDLNRLSNRVETYFQTHQSLPASTADLKTEPFDSMVDPVSNVPYIYRPKGKMAFELCAEFDSSLAKQEDRSVGQYGHPAGPHCFAYTVKTVTVNNGQRYDVQMAP